MVGVYKREIKRALKKSWESFCEYITKTAGATRLMKVLSKETFVTVCLKDGHTWTGTDEDSLNLLLDVHSPHSTAEW